MILLQLSSSQGPIESCLAVSKTLDVLLKEASNLALDIQFIEKQAGSKSETLKSVLLCVAGQGAREFAKSWHGTIQWRCRSPYRPSYRRKNWFVYGQYTEHADEIISNELQFETIRNTGHSRQYACKNHSAIKAIHVATGLSVQVQSQKSQHANKLLATAFIQQKLYDRNNSSLTSSKSTQQENNANPCNLKSIRVFTGNDFTQSTSIPVPLEDAGISKARNSGKIT